MTIIPDKYKFFVNNGIQKVRAQKDDIFLCSKSWDQEIIVFEFIFPYEWWNLAFFISEKWEKVI